MPKTKKAFERKYKDYSRRSLKYQFDIFVAAISEAVEYYMPANSMPKWKKHPLHSMKQ